MGKGDKKTAKGKRVMGSAGVTRQKIKNTYVPSAAPVKKAVEKKDASPKKAAAKKPAAKKAAPKKAESK